MKGETYIPRRLDDQWKIGFWDVDVAVPVLFCAFLGWLSGSKFGFAVCVIVGLWLARWVGRIKADKHPAYALHWLYWYLPTLPTTAFRSCPPASVGRMIG